MKRRIRILVVLASVLAMMTLSVGTAYADHGTDAHGNPAPPFEDAVGKSGKDATATTPVDAPVGTALGFPVPGTHPGIVNGNFNGIDNNPNCPAHYP